MKENEHKDGNKKWEEMNTCYDDNINNMREKDTSNNANYDSIDNTALRNRSCTSIMRNNNYRRLVLPSPPFLILPLFIARVRNADRVEARCLVEGRGWTAVWP